MKYCQNCGKEIDDNAVFCVHCGGGQQSSNHSSPQNGNTASPSMPAFLAKYSKATLIRLAVMAVLIVICLIKVPSGKSVPSFAGSVAWAVIIALIYAKKKQNASHRDVFKVLMNSFLYLFTFVLIVDAF